MNRLSRRAFVGGAMRLGVSAVGLATATGCSVLAPPAGSRQANIPRIGALLPDPGTANRVEWAGFRAGLAQAGWIEGQTITIEWRSAEGDFDRLPALAAELVGLPVDLIATMSPPATLAAQKATCIIPIVFIGNGDPVASGFVQSLARPGGNLTGVSTGASTPLNPKHLELLKDVVRGFMRVAYVVGPGTSGLALAQIQEAARALGVQVQTFDVRDFGSANDLASAFATAARWPADGVIVSGVFVPYRALVVDFAARSHMPAIYPYKEFVDAGGLMSYGTSATSSSRHAATYVDKILRGARPADLPVEQLTTLEFAVNLKTAEALGITFPPDVATQVTDWIQ